MTVHSNNTLTFDLHRAGVNPNDWERLSTTIKSNSLVKSVEVDRRGIMAVTPKLDRVPADKVSAKLEFLDEQLTNTVSHRAGSTKIQTTVGRGAGASGGTDI